MSNDYITTDDLRQNYQDPDGAQIRKTFGIPSFWKVEAQLESYEKPLPNAIVHDKDGSEWGHAGGTNWLAVGGKGSGKSTLALWLAAHLMARNGETVIWRGAEARSEWLPFKHWTKLYLPAGCSVTAEWRPEDVTKRDETEPADLDAVVDEVYRYSGLADLLGELGKHEFAVVYPDPEFRGCNEIMQESSYVQEHIEYVPASATDERHPDTPDPTDATPLIHWWIALGVARVEGVGGLLDWTSLIFDEVADLLPQSARANQNQTYEKLEVMRKVIADSRKYRLSVFAFGQDETNIHEKVRRTFEWRVAMPDQDGNPCQRESGGPPVGFSKVPMIKNFLDDRDAGYGICWTPSKFTRFRWQDIPDWEEDVERRLKISLDSSTHARGTESEADTPGPPTDKREVVGDD